MARHFARKKRTEGTLAAERSFREARICELTPMDVTLSGSVQIRYAVTVVGKDGIAREMEAHVELPDDARSLLEAMTWRNGASVLDVLGKIAVTCIRRLEASKLLAARKASRVGEQAIARIHASLSDVRSIVAEFALEPVSDFR
jgi:hypothetical protein